MAWRYNGACFLGDKSDPKAGDEVVIHLREISTGDSRSFTFEFDGTLTKPQFVQQVKTKVRNRLRRLNAVNIEDVTQDFEP